MTRYTAVRCPCRRCNDWHVEPVAAVQGVHFTQEQAEAVADLLNFKFEQVESMSKEKGGDGQ